MILTLRTIPRDDDQYSVVATCSPARAVDPEVLHIADSRAEAAIRIIKLAIYLRALTGCAREAIEVKPNRIRMTLPADFQLT